jgi:hypothetical protein
MLTCMALMDAHGPGGLDRMAPQAGSGHPDDPWAQGSCALAPRLGNVGLAPNRGAPHDSHRSRTRQHGH